MHFPSKKRTFRSLKSDTRQWTSGRVKFTVLGIEDKPETAYILFEKDFFGKTQQKPQRFILRSHDWKNLKKLIDEELTSLTQWPAQAAIPREELEKLLTDNPELLETVLAAPHIGSLPKTSLEALDRLAGRVFEIKIETLDLIVKRLEESKSVELVTFASLLQDLRLHQLSTLSALVYQKLRVIDVFGKLTTDEVINESKVHELFDKNIWLCGKDYEIIQSNKSLANYLDKNVREDPELKKRPDLIVKSIPNTQDVILIELKAPGVKLTAEDIGQVLSYRALIEQNQPSTKKIHCFLFGYEKSPTFTMSKDVEIKTFSELISRLKVEYAEYQRVIEVGSEEAIESEEDIPL